MSQLHIPTVPPTPAGSDSGSTEDSGDEHAADDKMELLVGDVRGRVAILIDDMIDTGHTVRLAAGVLQESGAKEVYALISHGESTRFDSELEPEPEPDPNPEREGDPHPHQTE
jgi:adenine/guanine phosphoribosyltransferase-like PRPP-binding protein